MNVIIAGGGTGGHLMPALAIAERLTARRPDINVILIGAARGIDTRLLPDAGYRYYLLAAEPIYRRQWWRNAKWTWLAWKLMRQVDRVLATERPRLVMGTGGYAAGPVVWRAARLGIPTAMHESNAYPGFATRRLARRLRHLYLGFPEARDRLPMKSSTQIMVTGTPIRVPKPRDQGEAREALRLSRDRPTVLVFGGSQGAVALNRAVVGMLETGRLGDRSLIWSTGHAHFASHRSYGSAGQVLVVPFLDPLDDAYAATDVAVTRAGAMTVAEVAAWGVPAIFVPLPRAAYDHQLHNARAVATAGGALVLLESELTPVTLADRLECLLADRARLAAMRRAQRARARPAAADDVVSNLLTLIP